jgi:hypothetical protein
VFAVNDTEYSPVVEGEVDADGPEQAIAQTVSTALTEVDAVARIFIGASRAMTRCL